METLLKDDARINNAKMRKDEREKKVREEEPSVEDAAAKRRRIEETEEKTLAEINIHKLSKIFARFCS